MAPLEQVVHRLRQFARPTTNTSRSEVPVNRTAGLSAPVFRVFHSDSCRQPRIQLIEDGRQLFAEKLVCPTQPTELVERQIVQVVPLDGQARGNVVPDRIQPSLLLGRERGSGSSLIGQPLLI